MLINTKLVIRDISWMLNEELFGAESNPESNLGSREDEFDVDVAQIAHDLEEDLYTIICIYNYMYTQYIMNGVMHTVVTEHVK